MYPVLLSICQAGHFIVYMVCRWWNTAYDRKNMIFKYLVILFSTTFQFSYKLSYLAMSTFNKAYWWCRRIDWDCFVWWICLWIINTFTRFIKKLKYKCIHCISFGWFLVTNLYSLPIIDTETVVMLQMIQTVMYNVYACGFKRHTHVSKQSIQPRALHAYVIIWIA